MGGFGRYDLRTTDPDAARAFYVDAVGLDFAGDDAGLAVWPLHEQARARGAPAHWLGSIDVADVPTAVQQLLDAGSESLGPAPLRRADGETFATVRDPCGAVVAVRDGSGRASRGPVAWHQLHTRDVDRSWELYSQLFGWSRAGTIDVAGPEGEHRVFRWSAAGDDVGSMANTARLPGVHAHWLFYFPIADLDRTLTRVVACGGRALAPFVLPDGDRIAACEDPQGAAFGLVRRV
jgi:predicted enzyme related to lactoylglutathione lyase